MIKSKKFFLQTDPRTTEKLVLQRVDKYNKMVHDKFPLKAKSMTLKKTHIQTLLLLVNKLFTGYTRKQFNAGKYLDGFRTNNRTLGRLMRCNPSTAYRHLERFGPTYIDKNGDTVPGLGLITSRVFHGTNAAYELHLAGNMIASYGSHDFATWLEDILDIHFNKNTDNCPGIYAQIQEKARIIGFKDAPQGTFQANFNPATSLIEIAAQGSPHIIAFCIHIINGTINPNVVYKANVNYFTLERLDAYAGSVIDIDGGSLNGTLHENGTHNAVENHAKPSGTINTTEGAFSKEKIFPRENFSPAADITPALSSVAAAGTLPAKKTGAELKLEYEILNHCISSLFSFAFNLFWAGREWKVTKLEQAHEHLLTYFLREKQLDSRQSWYSIQGKFTEIIHLSKKKADDNPAGFIANPDTYFDPMFTGGFARTKSWYESVIVPERKKKKAYHSHSVTLGKEAVKYYRAVKEKPNQAHETFRECLQTLGKKSDGDNRLQDTFIAATRDGIMMDRDFFERQWQNFKNR